MCHRRHPLGCNDAIDTLEAAGSALRAAVTPLPTARSMCQSPTSPEAMCHRQRRACGTGAAYGMPARVSRMEAIYSGGAQRDGYRWRRDHRPGRRPVRRDPDRRGARPDRRPCTASSAPGGPSCWPPGTAGRRELSAGGTLDFLPETRHIREDRSWRVAPPAPGLVDRRVEITGPTDRKMTINALNSGAKVWLADFEDANTPLWDNMITGQLNLRDALDRTIDFTSDEGKDYQLRPGRRAGHDRGPAARLAPGREAPAGRRPAGRPAACSTSRCTSSTAPSASWTRARARTSTWPRWRATWRPGSGTTRSAWPRTRSASRAARSGPPC